MNQNDPLAGLPEVPSFTVTSPDVAHGEELGREHYSGLFGVPGGKDTSPALSWSGAPPETKSYVLSVYDPDAPTGCGFWHWIVANIPASVTELPAGAGDEGAKTLPKGALLLRNDAGSTRFLGAGPPPGHGPHRYFIVVQALDVDDVGQLGVTADSTPAFLGFSILQHVLARAVITPWGEVPAN
jgi:Raf kinase inhibitor-like YbhB/YbcL family protein